MNKIVYIFTKTNWSEPPRIRHQLTQMLLKKGYEVIFFQKPSLNTSINKKKEVNLTLVNSFELFHHQLRPFQTLVFINKLAIKWHIKRVIKNEPKPDLIINFNYDYYFLNELFKDTKIITVINDDFLDMAKSWMKRSARKQLQGTVQNSNCTLGLSYSLVNQINEFTNNVELFLPWAGDKYKLHKPDSIKDTVLWWGYIRHDIDWDSIEYLLKKDVKILMVGPIVKQNNMEDKLNDLRKYPNFQLEGSKNLDQLNFDNICCSLLNYRKDVEYDKATTISNRGFNLLSNGIPLVYANLPNLIKAPSEVITKCDTYDDYFEAIEYFKKNWKNSQPYIEKFLESHYEEDRYKQFKEIIK